MEQENQVDHNQAVALHLLDHQHLYQLQVEEEEDQDLILLDKIQVPQVLEALEDQAEVVEEDSEIHLHLTTDRELELLDKVILEELVTLTLAQEAAEGVVILTLEMADLETQVMAVMV